MEWVAIASSTGSILIYFACIKVLWIERKTSISQNDETPGLSDNRGKSPGVLKSVFSHTKLHAFACCSLC